LTRIASLYVKDLKDVDKRLSHLAKGAATTPWLRYIVRWGAGCFQFRAERPADARIRMMLDRRGPQAGPPWNNLVHAGDKEGFRKLVDQ
jgi:hypothetical protein